MIDELVPQEYIVEKFYQYAGYPKHKKYTNVYEGGCPLCREGKSWGKKRRLYYVVRDNYIFCHNCGWSGSPVKWLQEVTNLNYFDIVNESKKVTTFLPPVVEKKQETKIQSLPGDCINLYDNNQCEFYKDDEYVNWAIETCKKRILLTAINRPKTLWFCRNDYVHKHRIIIPFYDNNNNIIFYQSRKLEQNKKDTKPKYLSKIGADRSVFNFDNIKKDIHQLFIFEGPIDSFFVENGVAVGGISKGRSCFTGLQEKQLNQKPLHEKIWVLDNQYQDETSREKTAQLLSLGYKCFIWPEELKAFKDLNEVCQKMNRDHIQPRFILSNSYNELKGKLLLSRI